MKLYQKILIGFFAVLGLGFSQQAIGATLQAFQGGTGISTSTAGNDGNCLKESSSSPFLLWNIGACGTGGGSSTTINGTTSSTFYIIGTGIITSTVSGATTTFSCPTCITTSTNNFGGLTGNSTSTYIAIYNAANQVIGYASGTYNSSTDLWTLTNTTVNGQLNVNQPDSNNDIADFIGAGGNGVALLNNASGTPYVYFANYDNVGPSSTYFGDIEANNNIQGLLMYSPDEFDFDAPTVRIYNGNGGDNGPAYMEVNSTTDDVSFNIPSRGTDYGFKVGIGGTFGTEATNTFLAIPASSPFLGLDASHNLIRVTTSTLKGYTDTFGYSTSTFNATGTANNGIFWNAAGAGLTNTSSLNLASNGHITIGSSTDQGSAFNVVGNTNFTNQGSTAMMILNTTGGAVSRSYEFFSSASDGAFGIFDITSSTRRMTISTNGDVSINSASDLGSTLGVSGTFSASGQTTLASTTEGNATSTGNISGSTILASTSITNQGVKSALVLNSAAGLEGAYAGNTCASGFASSLSATGVLTCAATSTNPGTVTTSTAGVTNTLPIWTSASALGNSHNTESGTSSFINASATYIGTNASSGTFQFTSNSATTKSYVEAGTSAVATTIGGALAYSATSTGNGAGASTTLETFTIPTSTYLTLGDEVDFFTGGTFAGTAATNKQIQASIGGTVVFDTGASFAPANTACNWFLEGRGMLTGTASTTWIAQFTDSCVSALTDDSGDAGNKTISFTTSSSSVMNIYGNATNASDVVANYFRVMYNPF